MILEKSRPATMGRFETPLTNVCFRPEADIRGHFAGTRDAVLNEVFRDFGDLEGFYISYTRAATCATEQVAQN